VLTERSRKVVIEMADSNRYEIVLSINGKQTQIATWDDDRSGDMTLELVRYSYKQLLCWLADSTDKQEKSASNQPYCNDHQVPMVARKSRFNNGMYWACPHKNEDGSYCKYRPQKS